MWRTDGFTSPYEIGQEIGSDFYFVRHTVNGPTKLKMLVPARTLMFSYFSGAARYLASYFAGVHDLPGATLHRSER